MSVEQKDTFRDVQDASCRESVKLGGLSGFHEDVVPHPGMVDWWNMLTGPVCERA